MAMVMVVVVVCVCVVVVGEGEMPSDPGSCGMKVMERHIMKNRNRTLALCKSSDDGHDSSSFLCL